MKGRRKKRKEKERKGNNLIPLQVKLEWLQNKANIMYPNKIPLQLTSNGTVPYKPTKSAGRKAILSEWDASVSFSQILPQMIVIDFMGFIFSKPASIKSIRQLAEFWAKRLAHHLHPSLMYLVICFDKPKLATCAKVPTQVRFPSFRTKKGVGWGEGESTYLEKRI